jgi:hypothetical protein
MPRGGKRRGAGRKPGATTQKTRAIANAAAAGMKCSPLDYMLGVVSDEQADVARRDSMAVASASFVHPKLSAVATVGGTNGGGNCVTNIQFLVIPRGCFLSEEQVADPSSLIEYGKPFEPDAMPTPALIDQTALPVEPEPAPEPLEVLEPVDDGKVVTLRRRDDGGGQ